MLNNKGFAITTILYGIMILFIMLLLAMLGILNNYKNNLSKLLDGSRDIAKIEVTKKICVSALNIETSNPSCTGDNLKKTGKGCSTGYTYNETKSTCKRNPNPKPCQCIIYGGTEYNGTCSGTSCSCGSGSYVNGNKNCTYTYSGTIVCEKNECLNGSTLNADNKCEIKVNNNEECPTGFTEK